MLPILNPPPISLPIPSLWVIPVHQPQASFTSFLMFVCLIAQSCPTLCEPMNCSPPGSSIHGDSPGKNIGVGCHALLQGIFPIQGLDLSLLLSPALQADYLSLSHQGSPSTTLLLRLSHSVVSDPL